MLLLSLAEVHRSCERMISFRVFLIPYASLLKLAISCDFVLASSAMCLSQDGVMSKYMAEFGS